MQKDALYFPRLQGKMQNRPPAKQAMGWLEKAEQGGQREPGWRNPNLDMHGSLVRGVDCEEPSSHEIHLDSAH